MIPLITLRSSTRAIPCDSGKYGSIRRICDGESQNKSLMAASSLPPVNQSIARSASELTGPEPRAESGGPPRSDRARGNRSRGGPKHANECPPGKLERSAKRWFGAPQLWKIGRAHV